MDRPCRSGTLADMARPAGTGPRMGGGVAAAAVALGVTQLLAAPFGPAADARTAVGSAVIDLTPGPVKEWAIQTFGTADKLFLSVAVRRGDRGDRRGRRDPRKPRADRSAASRSRWPGLAGCGRGAVPARAPASSTSSPS